MNHILISQQVEISYSEAQDLSTHISTWLSRPINQANKLEPFEVLAALQLMGVYKKLIRRLRNHKSRISKFKITFTAPEIIAMHEIINEYPVELYNILSQIDRKALNYDQAVNFNYSIHQ